MVLKVTCLTNLLLLPSMVGLIVTMVSPLAFRMTLASLVKPTATASCSWRSLVVMARSNTILWTWTATSQPGIRREILTTHLPCSHDWWRWPPASWWRPRYPCWRLTWLLSHVSCGQVRRPSASDGVSGISGIRRLTWNNPGLSCPAPGGSIQITKRNPIGKK